MRLLLDTNVVVGVLLNTLAARNPGIAQRLSEQSGNVIVSVASLWEIAIKTRLGKLDSGMPLDEIAGYLEATGLSILPVQAPHAITAADPEPDTRDPFDRLLLAQCAVESMRLVTMDRALRRHPLALEV